MKILTHFSILLLFISSLVMAETSQITNSEVSSLRDKAQAEMNSTQSAQASSYTNSGVIQLKDELNPVNSNPSIKGVSFKMSKKTHLGTASIAGTNQYYFQDLGSTYRPILSLSLLTSKTPASILDLRFGFDIEASFTAQDAKLLTTSQSSIEGRLQYFDVTLKPQIRIYPFGNKILNLKIYSEIGQAQIAMASRNSNARFSKNSAFYGYGFGLQIPFTEEWNFAFESFHRLTSVSYLDWNLTETNQQLGIEYLW